MRIVNSNLYAKYKPGTSHSAGLRCIYKAALALVAFLRKSTKATIYCHAQARLQGLQADPRRLADALAAHKSPCKTSVKQVVRRLALMGIMNRTVVIMLPRAPA